jgi:hypothetical protein
MASDDSKVLERFIARLNQAWRAAGQPSYGEMEALSAKLVRGNPGRQVKLIILSDSTTQQILAGKRLSAPKWAWVLSYVHVLRAAARKALRLTSLPWYHGTILRLTHARLPA